MSGNEVRPGPLASDADLSVDWVSPMVALLVGGAGALFGWGMAAGTMRSTIKEVVDDMRSMRDDVHGIRKMLVGNGEPAHYVTVVDLSRVEQKIEDLRKATVSRERVEYLIKDAEREHREIRRELAQLAVEQDRLRKDGGVEK